MDDNCPLVSNAGQQDADGDGIGNACSQDVDGDGIADGVTTVPMRLILNRGTETVTDGDVDDDIDGDGFNEVDNCPGIRPQLDLDGDLLGSACIWTIWRWGGRPFDSCPWVVNEGRDDEPQGEEDNIDSPAITVLSITTNTKSIVIVTV